MPPSESQSGSICAPPHSNCIRTCWATLDDGSQRIASECKSPASRQRVASESPTNRQRVASESPASRQRVANRALVFRSRNSARQQQHQVIPEKEYRVTQRWTIYGCATSERRRSARRGDGATRQPATQPPSHPIRHTRKGFVLSARLGPGRSQRAGASLP